MDMGSVFLSAGFLIVAIVVGAFFTMLVRKRMGSQAPSEAGLPGFTLTDLKDLHKAGQLTDIEFERAKAKIIERARTDTAKPAAGDGSAKNNHLM